MYLGILNNIPLSCIDINTNLLKSSYYGPPLNEDNVNQLKVNELINGLINK